MLGRSVRVIVVGGALALVATACGDPESSPSFSTIAVTSTAYVTVPARTTTTTIAPPANDQPAGDDDEEERPVESDPADDPSRERTYEVQPGDYMVGIASDFDMPAENIVEYNGWTDGLQHPLNPGDQIRIPPSDYNPDDGATATGDTAEPSSDESARTDGDAGQCDDGSAPDTYTIQPGDIPAAVAEDLGTTVEELAAANEDTVGYPGFVVGIEINVPC